MRDGDASSFINQLSELVANSVINDATADAIRTYYASRRSDHPRKVAFVLCAILGAVLVGGGVILLIAHNWDELTRPARLLVAFLPLLAAQILAGFTILRRLESVAWRESIALATAIAVGAAIALTSQTYQVLGTLSGFLLVSMLLSLPIVYLLRSTFAAILYVIVTVVWLCAFDSERGSPLWFWLLLGAVLPYLGTLLRRDRHANDSTSLLLFVAIAAAVGLGFTVGESRPKLWSVAFSGFFTLFYLVGLAFFKERKNGGLHPVSLLAFIGCGVLSVALSYRDLWEFPYMNPPQHASPTTIALGTAVEVAFPAAALLLAASLFGRRRTHDFNFVAAVLPIVTGLAWLLARYGQQPAASALIFDVYALTLGIVTLLRGMNFGRIGTANLGMLVIAGIVAARFFDSEIGFVVRGVGFIVMGVGFLVANFILFKKRSAA